MTRRRPILLAALCLLAGCGTDERVAPVAAHGTFAGTLSVDVRGALDVTIDDLGAGATSVRLSLHDVEVRDLVPTPLDLSGAGRREAFPEDRSELWTATFALPEAGAGACAGSPAQVALALRRRRDNAHVGGSLAVYCGTRAYGTPARIFRLAGDLVPR